MYFMKCILFSVIDWNVSLIINTSNYLFLSVIRLRLYIVYIECTFLKLAVLNVICRCVFAGNKYTNIVHFMGFFKLLVWQCITISKCKQHLGYFRRNKTNVEDPNLNLFGAYYKGKARNDITFIKTVTPCYIPQ